jgi:hypothetical protein
MYHKRIVLPVILTGLLAVATHTNAAENVIGWRGDGWSGVMPADCRPPTEFNGVTGKNLCQKKPDGKVPMIQQSYLIEDRMLTIPNASHSNIEFHLWDIDPANCRLLSEWKPPHTGTTGYNIFMEFPYEDGRTFIRALDGTVRCYDLRKP